MKGYKGFDKDLKCRDKQYALGREETEDTVSLCNRGLHFCENPHDVLGYYCAGDGNRFCEVEAGEVSDEREEDSERVAKRLLVKTEISVFHICKIAVSAFFENFGFKSKIDSADTNNAGDYGAANAGDRGAANAGDRGSASVKENGVAIASTAGKVKGGKGSVLVLVNRDNDGNITGFAAAAVDGATLLPDTWYHLKEGKFVAEE